MHIYWWILLAGSFVCCALYGWRMKKMTQAAITWPLLVVLGFVCAKVFYVLLRFQVTFPNYGMGAFLRLSRFDEYSFFGGCVGVCFAAALGAKLSGQQALRSLDVFAPFGCLLVALARVGEYELGMLGVGKYLPEDSPLCFFPVAVINEWEEWFTAVFMLEAFFALVLAIIVFCVKNKSKQGFTFRRTLFYLAMPQVLCESFRAQSMKWGFVRIEQLLCVVLMVALVAVSSFSRKELTIGKKLRPIGFLFLFVLVLIGVEFALDKTNWPHWFCYLLMAAALVGMSVVETAVVRKE